jgi:hypothetical protein
MSNIFYPLEIFSKWMTYKVLSISEASYLGSSVEFFILDTLKIFILLFLLMFTVSFFRSYLSKDKIQKALSHKKNYLGYFIAASFGIITPFCSCSAIPFFLTLIEAGVPIGITFSFLIASPMINEVALILLLGLFGIKVSLLYIFSGLFISIATGIILGKMHVDKLIFKDILLKEFSPKSTKCSCKNQDSLKNKLSNSKDYTFSIIKKIWLYVVMGVGLGAWIHGYVPNDFLTRYASGNNWFDVPLAVIVGIPLYSNAAGIIPLISSLTEKGLSMGTALTFMMSVTALSLPEFIILKRIMKWKLLLIYAAIVGVGITIIGYLFNAIL